MKKIINTMLVAIILTTVLSCNKDDSVNKVFAKSIDLNKTEVSIVEGESLQLKATVLPEETTEKTITWKSSNTNIAKVDDKGLITAIKKGEATISGETTNKLNAICKIIVSEKVIEIKSIQITNKEKELSIGKTLQITTEILPKNASYKELQYSSSNKNIASINDKGILTAIKEGEVTITASSTHNKISSELKIKITTPKVESISIKSYSHEMRNASYSFHRLIANVLPETLKDRSFTWTSSDPTVATIDNDGEIEAKGIGSTIMTVTAKHDGTKATYKINVINGRTILHELYNEKHKNDDSKTPGSWTYQKVIFSGDNSNIDMDYQFDYSYKKAEAKIKFAYKLSEDSEIIKHESLLFFTPEGFNLLNPIEINGKNLSHFHYDKTSKTFIIKDGGISGKLQTVENAIPVVSYTNGIFKHRLKSGDLEKNYSPKMWEYNNKTLEVLGIKRKDVKDYKFEFYTYIEPVAYEGNANLFTVKYYQYGKGSMHHDFQISGYDTTNDGSIVFKKDSDESKWFNHNDKGCKKLNNDPNFSNLLKAIFSNKGWKIVEEWEDVFVLISNEDKDLWFRVWVHYDDDDW